MIDTIHMKKRRTFPKKLLVIGVLLCAIGAVLLPRLQIFTRAFVVQELQNISDRVAADAKQNNATARFTYDDVRMEGSLFSRRAVVVNPAFYYTRTGLFGVQDTSKVSTPSVILTATSVKDKNVSITLPDPVTVGDETTPTHIVHFAVPPVVTVSYVMEGNTRLQREVLSVPGTMTLTAIKGKEDGTDSVIDVSFDADHTLMAQASQDGTNAEVLVKLANLTLSSEGESIDVATMYYGVKQTPATGGGQTFDAKFSLGDFGIKTASREGGPFSLNLKMRGEVGGSVAPKKGRTTIEEISLTAKEYSAHLSGAFETTEADPLPSGKATAKFTNVKALADQKLFGEKYTPLVIEALGLIAGEAPATLMDVEFAIVREPMGTVTIGKTTFEQLVGFVLSSNAKDAGPPSEEAASSPSAPAPEMPADAPVAAEKKVLEKPLEKPAPKAAVKPAPVKMRQPSTPVAVPAPAPAASSPAPAPAPAPAASSPAPAVEAPLTLPVPPANDLPVVVPTPPAPESFVPPASAPPAADVELPPVS